MKKPWRFTPKQVRRYWIDRYYRGVANSFRQWRRMEYRKMKSKNNQQMWLESHGWIEDGIYQDHHKHSATWNYW